MTEDGYVTFYEVWERQPDGQYWHYAVPVGLTPGSETWAAYRDAGRMNNGSISPFAVPDVVYFAPKPTETP